MHFASRFDAEIIPLANTGASNEALFEAYYTLLDEVAQDITTTKTVVRAVFLYNSVGQWKLVLGEDDYDFLDILNGGFLECLNQSPFCE